MFQSILPSYFKYWLNSVLKALDVKEAKVIVKHAMLSIQSHPMTFSVFFMFSVQTDQWITSKKGNKGLNG